MPGWLWIYSWTVVSRVDLHPEGEGLQESVPNTFNLILYIYYSDYNKILHVRNFLVSRNPFEWDFSVMTEVVVTS